MKIALKKLKQYRSTPDFFVGFGETNAWEELEKRVRL